ncbi:unnamed protein product [Auanema sp. JU1783]|nr:unnamed protein product [Auanema sp. JU1783]
MVTHYDDTYAVPSVPGDNRPLIMNGIERTVIVMEDEEYKKTCCFSTKFCSSLFLILTGIGLAAKYIVLGSDRELTASATILNFDGFFEGANVKNGFLMFHVFCEACLFITVISKKRQFLVPFILNQVFLITFELIVVITCIVFAASNSISRISDGCEAVLQEFIPNRFIIQISNYGDMMIVVAAGLLISLMILINTIMLSLLNRIYRYYRFVSFYRM